VSGGGEDVLAGGGEMGERMRALDWSSTPLGSVDSWPRALKTCVRILLTSRQPMWLGWGDELTFLYNDPYRSIVGGKHPTALGQPTAVVWREIWSDIAPRIQSALGGQEGTYDEALLLIMERNGYPEETYYTFSYSPIPDDQGNPAGIFCANTDDTRRIVGERQLALLRDLAASTAEARTLSAACALSVAGLESNPWDLPFALIYLLDADHARAQLVGSTRMAPGHALAPETFPVSAAAPWALEEVLTTGLPKVLSVDEAIKATLPHGAWDRPPNQVMLVPMTASGETGRAGVLVGGLNPYRPADADYERFMVLAAGQIAAAMSNAQAYEEERERAEALSELDRAKTIFFSNISHEFRTPLTLLLGPLDDILADDDDALGPDQREQLSVAHRNGLRLLRLVNNLLDFSRIEAGRVQAAFVATDLARMTADLASSFRSATERAGLRLVVDAVSLPADLTTYVDRDMWEKIVLNLLSNAFKHTFEGEIRVGVRPANSGEAVELYVEDTGTGIPPEELPRLFERFHRVQGAQSRTQEGTGIGLALVQELVRLHGGTISVESELGRGSQFTVAIPTGSAHLPAERIALAAATSTTRSNVSAFAEEAQRWLPTEEAPVLDTGPKRGRIVLADDNADMRDYLARLLARRYEVEAVADGLAALAAARDNPPDLVLTDVMMPRLDGFGLLRELRDDPATREVAIILLSARAGEEAEAEGLERGADDYLVKPFSARELLARVDGRVELARARREKSNLEREARRVVERERTRLQDLLRQAPAIIAVLRGPEHEYELVNDEWLRFNGGHDVVGMTVRDAHPELEAQGVVDLLDRVYATGQPYVGIETPFEFYRADSSHLEHAYLNFVYQPIFEDDQIAGVLAHAVEVTEQVRARERMDTMAKERDAFLSAASHDLKNPIAAIRATAQLLARRIARGGELQVDRFNTGLASIERSTDQMLGLINELVDLSRLRMGQGLALDLQPTDLVDMVSRAVQVHQIATDRHRIEFAQAPESVVGDWDPARIRRVIDNLLSNAIKYSPAGGTIYVAISVEHETGGAAEAVVTVRDEGLGIPLEEQDRIFEHFVRGTNVAHIQGTGIGLAGVREILEQHGGSITVTSEPGRGSTFAVRLPMTRA
jgi:signal transduction histidine kinase/FixJ family two-component response regulator